MKQALIVVGVTAAALLVGVTGCGDKKSSNASSSTSSSATSSTTTSTSASAVPADYTSLLIKTSDINAPGDPFTMQQPELNPQGKPGVSAVFVNSNQAQPRRIDDTIMVLPSASDASGALDATKTAAETSVSGPVTEPANVGDRGLTITGASPDGSQSVTILLFAQGKAMVTMEFSGAAADPPPIEGVVELGQKQADAIKAGLPG